MHARFALARLSFVVLLACGDTTPSPDQGAANEPPSAPRADAPPAQAPPDPATAHADERRITEVPRSPRDDAAFEDLKQQVHAAESLDAAGLRARYPLRQRAGLSYDPNAAAFLDRIQASALALSDGERAALGQHGFVVSTRREFPSFVRGLVEIYSEHLPLYVTVDALFEAVHASHEALLSAFERNVLAPELGVLLSGMRERLPSAAASPALLADMDLYLAVALGLLTGETPGPSAGAAAADIERIVALALAGEGSEQVRLFGVERDEDFSQFKPRGHYAGHRTLQGYFRALTWLGRVDFRLLETQSDGSLIFRRRQYESMLLCHELVGPDLARFERIEAVVRAFAGESDAMTLAEVPGLLADLGGVDAAQRAGDQAVAAAIVAGGYGRQQLASHLITNPGTVATLPLNRSFALFGTRYVADGHVLSEVVHDRVPDRMMPSTLEPAFAALGNAQALLYDPDLERFPALPGALARMRVLVDEHEPAFWQQNLYNLRLQAIRALSPRVDSNDPGASGLPELAGTEAWGRRILNAQLAAWAQLRHDTQVYAKQVYTAGALCEFPDAYVDPYPEVYAALHQYALRGLELAALAAEVQPKFAEALFRHYDELARVTDMLAEMAARELRGEPFSDAQLAFINEAVEVQPGGCSLNGVPSGWYARLFVMPEAALEFAPVVADVHTQPTDEAGVVVGHVLHIATGYPRMLVATVNTCAGPRAYAGVVHAYHEFTTADFRRLSDAEWAQQFQLPTRPADPSWLAPVLAR